MFLWQFNDGLGWRGGEGEQFPTVDAAAERAKQHWHRFPHDHLRVVGEVSKDRSPRGYLMFWWQDGSTAEERFAENGI